MPEDAEQLWWQPEVVVVRVRPGRDVPNPTLARHEDFLGDDFFSQAPGSARHRRLWLLAAVGLALAAAGTALGLVLADRGSTPGTAGSPTPTPAGPAVTLSLADFPTGWSVDRSAGPPLRGFLAAAPGGPSADPGAGAGSTSVVARQYESCLGVGGAGDALFGLAAARPVSEVSSPSFRLPQAGAVLEAASQTALFASATSVRQAAQEMSGARFGTCFGAALSQELMAGATEAARSTAVGPAGSASSTVTFGSPSTTVLTLPRATGTAAAGVQVSVPFVLSGADHRLGIGMVLIDRGRRETTLVTLSGPAGFPDPLLAHLTAALEQRLRRAG